MTDKHQYICPLGDCEYSAGSRRSVENHINGSTTGPHDGESGGDHRDRIKRVAIDDPDSTAPDRAESADGSEVQPARFPESDRGEQATDPHSTAPADRGDRGNEPGCCSDPTLEEPDAEAARLEAGGAVAFEDGDRFCSNCDAVVEADGNVIR
jgi:hypothetical protein